MARVFIFSDSFTTRTMLFKSDYLLSIKIDEILLLKENHSQNEKFILNNSIKIKLYGNIDDCINCCDFILIIKGENTPEKSIDYIFSKSKELNKKYFEVINPWKKELSLNIDHSDYREGHFNKCPVILNISLGTAAQQYCVEVLLNKIMTENKVSFKQFFSEETKDFLQQIDKCGILNNNLSQQLNLLEDQYNVILCSINIGSSIYNVKKYIDILRHIASDFTILQTDIKFNEYEVAKNIMEYSCFSQLDMLIKSRYKFVYNNLILYCNENKVDNSIFQDLESIYLEKELSLALFSKIALPEGIVKY